MGDVTLLLEAAHQGAPLDVDRIFELLYPELKRIAHAQLRFRNDRFLMETSSLVHEAYLRLLGTQRLAADQRGRFLAYTARVMRSVVVDVVREQQALRRGGVQGVQTLDTTALNAAVNGGEDQVLRVHEALQALTQVDERLVQVVEMRYFVGMDNAEIAASLGLTTRTVERDWQKARSFLFHAMRAG